MFSLFIPTPVPWSRRTHFWLIQCNLRELYHAVMPTIWIRSLSVLSKLFKVFTRYRGNNTYPDEYKNKQTNERMNASMDCPIT